MNLTYEHPIERPHVRSVNPAENSIQVLALYVKSLVRPLSMKTMSWIRIGCLNRSFFGLRKIQSRQPRISVLSLAGPKKRDAPNLRAILTVWSISSGTNVIGCWHVTLLDGPISDCVLRNTKVTLFI